MSHKLNLRGALEQVRISHAARVLPVVRDIQGSGRLTLDELAAALNAQGIPTADGHNWSPARLRELFAEVRRNGRGEVGFEYVVLGAVIVAIISGIWSASVPTIIAALSSALTAIGGGAAMSQFVITLLLASGIALGVVVVCVLLQMLRHRVP